MIKLLSLRGIFSGSAAAETHGKTLKLTIKLRGKNIPESLTAYLLGGKNIVKAVIRNGCCEAEAADFSGLIIADGEGNFISEGLCGMDIAEFNKAKASVRMMRSSETIWEENPKNYQSGNGFKTDNKLENAKSPLNRADRGERTAASRETRKANTNRSGISRAPTAAPNALNQPRRNAAQVTSEILETARKLFEFQSNMGFSPSPPLQSPQSSQASRFSPSSGVPQREFSDFQPVGADKADLNEKISQNRRSPSYGKPFANAGGSVGKPVENPFPKVFPDSSWKDVSGGGARLKGTARIRGVIYDMTALRSNNGRYPPKGLKGSVRHIVSKTGKPYWIGIMPRKPQGAKP